MMDFNTSMNLYFPLPIPHALLNQYAPTIVAIIPIENELVPAVGHWLPPDQ